MSIPVLFSFPSFSYSLSLFLYLCIFHVDGSLLEKEVVKLREGTNTRRQSSLHKLFKENFLNFWPRLLVPRTIPFDIECLDARQHQNRWNTYQYYESLLRSFFYCRLLFALHTPANAGIPTFPSARCHGFDLFSFLLSCPDNNLRELENKWEKREEKHGLTKIKKQKTDRVALTSSHISTLLSLWMYRYERIDDILGQTCFFLPLPPLSKYFRTVEWMSCSLLLYFSFLSPSFHHGDVWKLAPVEAVWSRGIVQIKPPSRTKRRVKIEFKKKNRKETLLRDR